ncbi:hypothetical protein J2T60_002018 [Natronospira proteinivora]|uniref:Uncharacterized protein n=1 Tax=Natronospira proteinivora TaxID=1807133 RepID=A0ABT1GCL5_9GAMM|nr:hypothetical protein [Natronospira proteinivora]MCP1728018.1 hypothetical protein [Natronospira proteinivora]
MQVILKLLGVLLCLALVETAMARDWDGDWSLRYEARLSSETLHPTVAGEDRQLEQQIAGLHFQEVVAGGIYGGLSAGFPSIRWQQPGRDDSPRMGGWQLGLSLGGRHPHNSELAMVWEASYGWIQVSGDLAEDESLSLDLRETSSRVGLDWQRDAWAITVGVTRRHWDGEERIDGDSRGPSRNLSWRPDDHAFIETRLRINDSGWLSLGLTNTGEDRRITLGFGRGY